MVAKRGIQLGQPGQSNPVNLKNQAAGSVRGNAILSAEAAARVALKQG